MYKKRPATYENDYIRSYPSYYGDKSRSMRWVEHVSHKWGEHSQKTWRQSPLGRYGHRREEDIQYILKTWSVTMWTGFIWAYPSGYILHSFRTTHG